MRELNGNEKYHDLTDALPFDAANPRTIHPGDLMLFASRTVVRF